MCVVEKVLSRFFCSVFFLLASMSSLAATPSVSMTFSPSTVGPGATSTLTYTIDNSVNSTPITEVTLLDTLPAGMTIKAPPRLTSTCYKGEVTVAAGGNSIALGRFRMAAGQVCRFSVDVSSQVPGVATLVSNSLTSSEGASASASASLTVDGSRPGYTLAFVPSTIAEGGISRLVYSIDNSVNGANAILLVITDSLPAGVVLSENPRAVSNCNQTFTPSITAEPGGSSITLQLGGVAAGASCTMEVDVKAQRAGVYDHLSGVLSQNGANPSGPASAQLTVINPFLKMAFDGLAGAGDTVDVVYTLKNVDRTNTATGISFSHDLDAALAGLIATTLPNDGFCGPDSTISGLSTLAIAGASLLPEESCTFTVSLSVPAAAATGLYTSTTTDVAVNLAGPRTQPAATGYLDVVSAPRVSLQFLQNPVSTGDLVTARFVLENMNTATSASGIGFTMMFGSQYPGATISTLPAANSCGAGSSFTVGVSVDTQYLNVVNASLAAGASCTFDLVLSLPDSGLVGNFPFATGYVSATMAGNRVYSPGTSATLQVGSAPVLSLWTDTDDVAPGDTVTATFSLRYGLAAAADVTGVGFSLDLDSALAGLVAVGLPAVDVCGAGSSLSGSANLVLAGATLAPGDTCTFSTSLQIPVSAVPGAVTLTSSNISGTVAAQPVISGGVSHRFAVQGLQFSKSFLPNPVLPGEQVVMHYSLTNASTTLTATDISFTEDLARTLSSLVMAAPPVAPCGGSISGTTSSLVFQIPQLLPEESCGFDVLLQLPANANPGSYTSSSNALTATVNGVATAFGSAVAVLDVETLVATLRTSAAYPTLVSPIPVSIVFSRDVTDFTLSDLVVGNGVATNLAGSGSTYSAEIVPTTYGEVTLQIPALAVTDAQDGSTGNAASATLTAMYAETPASLVITTPAGSASQTGESFTIRGSHTVNTTEVAVYADANDDGVADSSTALATTTVANNRWSLPVSLALQAVNNYVVVWEDRVERTAHTVNVPAITETTPDYDPVISGVPSSSVDEDSAYSFTPTASDANTNQTISFSIVNRPTWASFSTSTGALTGTPVNSDVGTTSGIVITVTDSTGASASLPAFSLTVNNVNDAPVISGSPAGVVAQGQTYSFTPTVTDVDVGDTHTFSIANPPFWATFSTATGALTGTPGNSDVGTASNIVISVTDSAASTVSLPAFSVTVSNVNDAPVIAGSPATRVDEDTLYSFTPTASDIDVGDSLSFSIQNRPGWASFNTVTGELRGTPANGDVGTTTGIVITVADLAGATNALPAFSLTVDNVNDAPTASGLPARVTVQEDTASAIDLSAAQLADVDSNNLTLTLSVSAGSFAAPTSSGGVTAVRVNSTTVTLSGQIAALNTYLDGNSVVYTGAENASGANQAQLTVYANDGDGSGNLLMATIAVDITAVNDAPNAVNDSASTNEDIAVAISVLANDSDIDDSLNLTSVAIASGPAHGSATVNTTTGVVTYTPAANFNGSDSFTYTVRDQSGAVSNAATVSVTVAAVNDAPVAVADSATTPEDTQVTINVAANDTDIDTGDAVVASTLVITTAPAHGTAVVSNGQIRYTPALNFNGADSLAYTIEDSHGAVSNAATVLINVTGVNDLPVAANDSATVQEDGSVQITVTANDSDADGTLDLTTVQIVTAASHGSTAVNAVTGVVTYTPAANYYGADSFRYVVRDNSNGVSNMATVSLTVTAVNDAPIARADTVTASEDTALRINVTGNDEDIDGSLNLSTLAIVTAASHGTAVGQTDGTVLYTPSRDYNGADSFSYRLQDDAGTWSAPALVSVTVQAVNDAPTATGLPARVSVDEDTATGINLGAGQVSDVDSSHLTLTLTVASGSFAVPPSASGVVASRPASTTISLSGTPADLTLYLDTASRIQYTGAQDGYGTNSDQLTVSANDGDGSGEVRLATISIDITGVNDAPQASDDTGVTPEDTPLQITVLSNDSDIDDSLNPASVALVTPPAHGSASINTASGIITYSPSANFNGSDSFTYTVHDLSGSVSNAATVTVTVSPVNDAPVAVADSVSTPEDTAVTIDVAANDTDVDSGDAVVPASIVITTAPEHGSASVSNGRILYTPVLNFNGADRLAYTIEDSQGAVSAAATVLINVTGVNDLPAAVDDSASLREDDSVEIAVTANDSDSDGSLDLTSVHIILVPSHGAATVDAVTGAVTYRPAANYAGADSFTYVVRDDSNAVSNIATVSLTVTPVNDAPLTRPDAVNVREDTPLRINVTGNDVDVDGSLNLASLEIVTDAGFGTVLAQTDGTVLYTPNHDYFGADAFSYRLQDNEGAWSPATVVSIYVDLVNDSPVANQDTVNTAINTPVVIRPLSNDTDVDGTVILSTLTLLSTPLDGTLSNNGDGSLTYTPNTDFVGRDSFTYQVADDQGALSNVATVRITVVAVNQAPVITGTPPTRAQQNSRYSFTPSASDADNDALVFSVANLPAWASFDSTSGQLSGTPTQADVGAYHSIIISVSDGSERVALTAFSITVDDVNDAPVATAETYRVTEGARLQVSAVDGVLANDTDLDGDTLTAVLVTPPASAARFVLNSDGSFDYLHNGGELASDTFVYTANDGQSASAAVTVTISVINVNDPPVFTTSPPAAVITQGETFSYTVGVSDSDSAVSLELLRGPAWLSLDNVVLSGTAPLGAAASNDIVLRLSDGEFSIDQAFALRVLAEGESVVALASQWRGLPALVDDTAVLVIDLVHEHGAAVDGLLTLDLTGADFDAVAADCASVTATSLECALAIGEGGSARQVLRLTPHTAGDITVQLRLTDALTGAQLATASTDISATNRAVSRGNHRLALADATAIARLDSIGDGRHDLLIGRRLGQPVTLVHYDETLGAISPFSSIENRGATAQVKVADVDDDGLQDIILINSAGDVGGIYFDTGNGQYLADAAGPDLPLAAEAVVQDLNRDGYPELIVGAAGADIYLYVNNGGRYNPVPYVLSMSAPVTHLVALAQRPGDADLAGRLVVATEAQLLLATFDLTSQASLKPKASAPGRRAKVTLAPLAMPGVSALQVVDLAASGTEQVVVGHAAGVSLVAVSDEGLTVETRLGNASTRSLAVGDFNGDSHPDILVNHPNGALQIYQGDGSRTGLNLNDTIIFAPDALSMAYDLNDDGLTDILTYQPGQERVDIYLLTASGDRGATGDLLVTSRVAAASDSAYWLDYWVTVTNQGSGEASDIVTYTDLPEGMSVISLPANCSVYAPLLQCTHESLAAGATVTFEFRLASATRIDDQSLTTRTQSSALEETAIDNKQQENLDGLFQQTAVKAEQGGGGGAFGVPWLLAALVLVRRRRWWCALLLTLGMGASSLARAGSPGPLWQGASVELGLAPTRIHWQDRADVEQRLAAVTQEAAVDVSKSQSLNWSLLLAYPVQPWFSLEAGYLSVGNADLTVDAVTSNTDRLVALLGDNYPLYGAGPYLGTRFNYRWRDNTEVFAKVGLWSWEQSFDVSYGNSQRSFDRDGSDIQLSGGIAMYLDAHWSTAMSLSRIRMDDQDQPMLSFSLRYTL